MSYFEQINIQASDSPSIDAFGLWRVSNPQTLFDSKNIFDDDVLGADVENQPLFFDNQQTAGSGTTTAYAVNEASQSLSVALNTLGTRVRQTKMRFNYQPGKSQLVLLTFNLNGAVANITKREGIFDANNGLFFETLGTTISFVRRTYVTGSAVDTKVAKASWNIDPMDGTGKSGITLDFTKTQILFIDYEWLGVGRVRLGWVVAGAIHYAHEFLNSNVLDKVYMSTPNLPLRSEISNDGGGAAASITQICSTVISEGGSQDLGAIRYASTAGTHVDVNTENTLYAIVGIRLKAGYLGASIKVISVALQEQAGSKKLEWQLLLNPTVADVFTYNGLAQSAIEYATGATAKTIRNGYVVAGGFLESGGVQSGNSGSASAGLDNAILLGSTIAGASDTLVLCARPIGGASTADVEGAISWRELV